MTLQKTLEWFIGLMVILLLISIAAEISPRVQAKQTVGGVIQEVDSCNFASKCRLAVQVGATTEYWIGYGTFIKGQEISRTCTTFKEISKIYTKCAGVN